jgi:hypothetical protein
MTVNVATYYHPKQWQDHQSFNEIKGEIHICATKNMAEGIKERYRDDVSGDFQYIFTIHQLMMRVFSRWHSPEQMLGQYLSLSRIINGTPGDKHLKDAFRNNTTELLDSIRSLVFSGVSPDSLNGIQSLTEKEKFFGNVWYRLEKENSVFEKQRGDLKKKYEVVKIQEYLNKILQSRFEKDEDINLLIPASRKKLVLHGFYFITPEQQVFLKMLERSGFELVFFQFYDKRFPNTFDFSRRFISGYFGWTDNWNFQPREAPQETIGSRFLRAFEEGTQDNRQEEKKVYGYESFFDFLHSVIMKHHPICGLQKDEEEEDVQIIATNADILNELLVQYYPERFADRRNFLNYPVGQFILKIHEMRQGNKFILNNDILMASFSSGWLTDKETNENARQYTYQLEQLLPFFSNCIDLDDWLERMIDLLDQYQHILPLFEREGDNRVLESIRSPFTRIGHLALAKKDVEQIKRFILLLEEMANDLFDLKIDEMSINEHFKRLSDLMREHNPVTRKVLLQKEEEDLIEKISYKISKVDDTHQFLYEDIGKAIQFYLSGNFSEDEDTFIKPFIEVDGEAFKRSNRKVYLTGLDEQGLPLSEFSIPWPLQEKTYSALSKKHLVLELNELRNNSVKDISRYLLFITLEFLWDSEIELSWLRNFLDRENLEPAVYVQYLNMEVAPFIADEQKVGEVPFQAFDFSSYQPNETDLEQAFEELKYEDILADYELCPRRFYFGYVLDRYPTYSDEFIYQFLFSEIVKLVKRYTRQEDDAVIEMVGNLFPQWTQYQKENMAITSLQYVRGNWDRKSQVTGNVSVSETRKNFQFPGLYSDKRAKLYDSVALKKEKIMETIQEPSPSFSIVMEATPEYHCRFCPFLDLCPEGKYAVDGKGKK